MISRQMRRNVRVAIRQKNGFPCPSRIHKWTITLLSRHFVPLRGMNWGEDLLFNRINVKLKCAVFIHSNIFPTVTFWNKLVSNCTPSENKLMQIFSPKVAPAAEIFVCCGFLTKRSGAGPGEVKGVNFHPPFSEPQVFFLFFSYPLNIDWF